MHQLTPERRFADLLAADGARPFVTYYDEATGERSELSLKSLGNWVAKTRNLLGDELGLGLGDTAVVALPAHWLTVPVVLGCLAAGLTVAERGRGDVGFGVPDTLDMLDTLDTYAVNPERGAVGFGDSAPGGALDYVVAVRPQADAWGGVAMPASPGNAATPLQSRADALAEAATRAAELGLAEGGRLLVTGDASWHDTVLVPLAAGGSVVIVRNADDDVLARRVQQERVTARV